MTLSTLLLSVHTEVNFEIENEVIQMQDLTRLILHTECGASDTQSFSYSFSLFSSRCFAYSLSLFVFFSVSGCKVQAAAHSSSQSERRCHADHFLPLSSASLPLSLLHVRKVRLSYREQFTQKSEIGHNLLTLMCFRTHLL